MILNIIKILLTRFYKNWLLRKKEELMIARKVQFNLVNGMNLVVGRNHFLFLRQTASLPGDVNPYDLLSCSLVSK